MDRPKPGARMGPKARIHANTARIQAFPPGPRQVFGCYNVVAMKVEPYLQRPDSIDGGTTAGRGTRRAGQQSGVRPDGRPVWGDHRAAAAGVRPRRASADSG